MNQHTIFHKPVLVQEVIDTLAPQPGKTYIDATFGGGGHTRAILDTEPTCSVIAFDWDQNAIEQNAPKLEAEYGDRLKVRWGNFVHLYKLLKKEGIERVDGILADFGTSQFQIHERAGFSFQKNSPLDMRMSAAHQQTTAADIINNASEQEIAHLLYTFGQEPLSRKIAHTIVEQRKKQPFQTTRQLVDLIESLIPVRIFKAKRGIHPATKTFQALRIAVNNELKNIDIFLKAALHFLAPGGRLVCISFHSLEDRMVKQFFKDHGSALEILTPKPLIASPEELAINPSSRSAKLRAARKN